MKKIILVLLSFVLVHAAAFAETYTVKPESSEVKWTATKVAGKHFGRINVASGTVEFADGKFSGGEAVIDTQSIVVDDIKSEGGNKILVGHLKNADFFDVETFPTASIKITGVKPLGENLYDVTADLTIKNITQPVSFQANLEKTDAGVKADAKISVDRTLYDIRYGSGKFFESLGDKTIHDNFSLEVSIQAA